MGFFANQIDKRDRFVGQMRQRASAPYTDARTRLLQTLTQGATGSPLSSPVYTQGLASLKEALGQQAEGDGRRAASRGLAGGELELAQLNSRTQALVGGQRALLGQADASQRSRQALLEALIGRKASEDLQRYSIDRSADEAEKNRRNALLGTLLGGGIGLL